MQRAWKHFGALFAITAAFVGCTGTIGDATDRVRPGSTGSGGGGGGPLVCGPGVVGVSPLRRLTRLEYSNTVRALIGEDLQPAKDFIADERAGSFPANYFSPISDLQFGEYATAAATVAERAVAQKPTLLPCDPAADEVGCASRFIHEFGRRAYRRPLEASEESQLQGLFELGRKGAGFDNGMKLVVEAMLQSPHFLYLVEGPGPLTPHQLAARLSYFLWKGPPDAQLSQLADSGQLTPGPAFAQEARRLLADDRAKAMLDDFHTYWLRLEEYDKAVRDAAAYPAFAALRDPMREEMRRFVSYVFSEGDGRLETLLTAPYSVVNGPLAAFYGARVTIPNGTWQKVALDPAQRSGLLTQGVFLTTHGNEGSAPIHRGVTLREQFFCLDLPPPPPNAGKVPPPEPTTTTRQRLDRHRANSSCAGCHTLIDGLGFGLEAYDAIGAFRETENGQKVDDSGKINGTDVDGSFKGARELSERLVRSEDVHACVVGQWFRYALGRMETDDDRCALQSFQTQFAASNLSIPELLVAIVESDTFLVRRGEE
jgi:hypothetical protein